MVSLNDVLLAMSNIPVDDPIAEILGRGLQGGYKIIEYTGSLPITINANGDALLDYRIYGNTVQNGTPTPENPIMPIGCGERTENLFDYQTMAVSAINCYLTATGQEVTITGWRISDYIPCSGKEFTINKIGGDSPAVCLYDENKQFLTGKSYRTSGVAYKLPVTVSSATDAKYIRFSYVTLSDKLSEITITEGSTPPSEYIPYGYKLPMTVHKQEFMVTGDMLDQSNWVLSSSLWYAPYFMYFDISDLISKEECVAKIYENFSAMYTPEKLVVALTDDMYEIVDAKYRILNNYGVILNREFDFSSWDKIYLCIGYGDSFTSEDLKQSKIDELFENWKILIAPTSQTRESPIYIGENQLGEGEYVSYSDGKIYRMVDGTLTPTDPPVPFPEIPTINGKTVIDYDGEPKPSQMYVKYKGKEVQ